MRKSTFEYFVAQCGETAEGRRADEVIFETLRSCCGTFVGICNDTTAVRINRDGKIQFGTLIKPNMETVEKFNRQLGTAQHRYGGTRKCQRETHRIKDELREYLKTVAGEGIHAVAFCATNPSDAGMVIWYDRGGDSELYGYRNFKFDPEDGDNGDDLPEDEIDELFNAAYYKKDGE